MAITPQSLDNVADMVSRMQQLRSMRSQFAGLINDNPDLALPPSVLANLKADWLSKFDAIRLQVIAEVAGW